MRVPLDVAKAIAAGQRLGFSCMGDGTVIGDFESGWGGGAYPPPGYLPWNALQVGNGDTYGYYWPLGREDAEPIVCTLTHDCGQILPANSDLAGCVRTHLKAGVGEVEEVLDLARSFDVDISGIEPPNRDLEEEPAAGGIGYWGVPSADELLPLDPSSPHLLLLAAGEAIARRQPEAAEKHLLRAVAVLPEYAEAWALLAQVCRQQQDLRRAAESLMLAITSPLCFGAADRKKLMASLQRMPEGAYAEGADPLWSRRHRLTLERGGSQSGDYEIMEEMIQEYHRLGMGSRAVRLRIVMGEMMGRETVSFCERSGWAKGEYTRRLRQELRRAGLDRAV